MIYDGYVLARHFARVSNVSARNTHEVIEARRCMYNRFWGLIIIILFRASFNVPIT